MNGIQVYIDLIITMTGLSVITFIAIHLLRNSKKRALYSDVSRVESKLASLRLNLKARVKKKVLRYRASYPDTISAGDPVDATLTKITDLAFDKNADFQDYIELCRKMNDYIEIASSDKDGSAQSSYSKKMSFMGTDFKNELNIVRTINDMVIVSKALYKHINRFNNFEKKIKVPIREPIHFASLFEIQSIYSVENDQAIKEAEAEYNGSNQNVA